MESKTYSFNTLSDYKFADIISLYRGKWIFCKQKEKTTWEYPSGHIEIGETPLEAAKRELYEETGAIDFDIEPLCDYYFNGELNGNTFIGNGQVYFAIVHTLGELPYNSEMERIEFFDSIPDELTYPVIRDFFPIAIRKKESIANEKTERLAIPGVGGIIIKEIDGQKHILLQERYKKDAPSENGLLEVPAGRIREFENIFDTLKREVKEETGLDITKIYGEELSEIYSKHEYKVINFMPFSCSQNLEGQFPFMVLLFICHAEGELMQSSDESRNYKWVSVSELKKMLVNNKDLFFPMHYNALQKFISSQQTK